MNEKSLTKDLKTDVARIESAELCFPDREIEVIIEFKRSFGNQSVTIPISTDINDFWGKMKKLQIQFQIDKLSELVGKYCLIVLSNEINERIVAIRLCNCDKRYDNSDYNETLIKPEFINQ